MFVMPTAQSTFDRAINVFAKADRLLQAAITRYNAEIDAVTVEHNRHAQAAADCVNRAEALAAAREQARVVSARIAALIGP